MTSAGELRAARQCEDAGHKALKGVCNLDARTFFFLYATGITPAMAEVIIGKGLAYSATFVDADGAPFEGGKTYKLHLPPIPTHHGRQSRPPWP